MITIYEVLKQFSVLLGVRTSELVKFIITLTVGSTIIGIFELKEKREQIGTLVSYLKSPVQDARVAEHLVEGIYKDILKVDMPSLDTSEAMDEARLQLSQLISEYEDYEERTNDIKIQKQIIKKDRERVRKEKEDIEEMYKLTALEILGNKYSFDDSNTIKNNDNLSQKIAKKELKPKDTKQSA